MIVMFVALRNSFSFSDKLIISGPDSLTYLWKKYSALYVFVWTGTICSLVNCVDGGFRRKGAIITVSSGACFLATPQMTVYAATKVSFVWFPVVLFVWLNTMHWLDTTCT